MFVTIGEITVNNTKLKNLPGDAQNPAGSGPSAANSLYATLDAIT